MISVRQLFKDNKVSPAVVGWALILLSFMCSFFVPIPSKFNNNYFYILMAVPALFASLKNYRNAMQLLLGFPYFLLSIVISVIIYSFHGEVFKDSAYILLFLVFLNRFVNAEKIQELIFLAYAGVVFAVMLYAYLTNNYMPHSPSLRLMFYGQTFNPVYAASMILVAAIYLWIFHLEAYVTVKPRFLSYTLIVVYFSFVLAILAQFEARSAIVGLVAFILFYAYVRRLFGVLFFALILCFIVIEIYGLPSFLLQRGFSFRGEIWLDAIQHINSSCSIFIGCSDDDYLFLGKFSHAHSAYLSMFYEAGIISFAVFMVFAFDFFRRCLRLESKWFLVALPGWFALLTTTSGIYTSPKPLWIYFWLPTFFAMIECYKLSHFKNHQIAED